MLNFCVKYIKKKKYYKSHNDKLFYNPSTMLLKEKHISAMEENKNVKIYILAFVHCKIQLK